MYNYLLNIINFIGSNALPLFIALVIIIPILILLIYAYRKRSLNIDDDDYAGFVYDKTNDIFYAETNCWQRNFGFCKLYDDIALLFSMHIHSEPIYFEYKGKHWLIEFWKGQYGITTGCEIGIYNNEGYFNLNKKDIIYNSASDEEMIKMSYELYKSKRLLFSRQDTSWWLTGFRVGMFSKPKELTMKITIEFVDVDMQKAFLNSLMNLGYTSNNFCINGNKVKIIFDKPYSKQPLLSKTIIPWIVQQYNKYCCDKYNQLSKGYENVFDKLDFANKNNKMINIGRTKNSYKSYYKVNKNNNSNNLRK